jgi:hypothetical protein
MPDPSRLEHDDTAASSRGPLSALSIAALVVGVLAILICWLPIIGVLLMPVYWLGAFLGGGALVVAVVERNENSIAFALVGIVLTGIAWYMAAAQQRVIHGVVGGAVSATHSTLDGVESSLDSVGNVIEDFNKSMAAAAKEREEREKTEKAQKEKEAKARAEQAAQRREQVAREIREYREREQKAREAGKAAEPIASRDDLAEVAAPIPSFEGAEAQKAKTTNGAKEKAKAEEAQYRIWISADGKFTTEAKVMSYANGNVNLETREDKKKIKVPLEKLSKADQDFVAKWRKSKSKQYSNSP